MKTLDQIEPRTPVASVPFTITNPGSYYLTSNLVLTINANAISIAANQVTLDLNGFTISTSVLRGTGAGILLNGGNTDITIFNGHVANVSVKPPVVIGKWYYSSPKCHACPMPAGRICSRTSSQCALFFSINCGRV